MLLRSFMEFEGCGVAVPDEELRDFFVGLIGWEKSEVIMHRFSPQGMSLVLAESTRKMIVHTWPEKKALSVDLYLIGGELEAAELAERIKKKVRASKVKRRSF